MRARIQPCAADDRPASGVASLGALGAPKRGRRSGEPDDTEFQTPKLGTQGKPAVVRVLSPEDAEEVLALCQERGWKVWVRLHTRTGASARREASARHAASALGR